MSIVVFSKLFWPEGGGAELATHLVVKDILSKHFNVIVVSGTENPHRDVLKCCRYIHWSVLESKYKPVEWLKMFLNTQMLRELVKEADTVYIPSHTLIPLAVVIKRLKPRVKVVLHLHNYQPLTFTSVILADREPDMSTDVVVELGESNNLLRAMVSGFGHHVNYLNKLSLLYADRVICVSRRQQEILTKHIPSIREKTTVIYNPLPPIPNIEKKLDKTPTILYAGGGSYVKGFHIAIKVITNILAKHNYKIYVTYGRSVSIKQAQLLKELSEKFGKNLILLGRVPHEEVIKVYSRMWALFFPSIYEEPLPYTVLEAMLANTIPVASKVGGVPEIVEGTFAEKMLFKPYNTDEFVDRMESLLAMSKEQIIDVGLSLKEAVLKKFNSEVTKRKLIEVFLS